LLRHHAVRPVPTLLDETFERVTAKLLNRLPMIELARMLEVFSRREREERTAVVPQLPLELAVVELTSAQPDSSSGPTNKPSTRTNVPAYDRVKPSVSRHGASGLHRERAEVLRAWPEVLLKVSKTNPSLSLILKSATPQAIVEGILTVSVQYPFHRERLSDQKNRKLLEAVVSAALGNGDRVKVQVTVDSSSDDRGADPAADVWQQALQAFGGEAIE